MTVVPPSNHLFVIFIFDDAVFSHGRSGSVSGNVVDAMRAGKKIISKIDGTTKNSFLDGIIGNVSDLTSIIKRTDIVDIVIKDIGKRFLAFDLIGMIKIV